jgi:CRISPR-associated protein Csd2
MGVLQNKIDFTVIFSVNKANPNGDPLDGNRPRVDYDGYGEVSDVCLKRKIRNRLQDFGERIFVQSDERKDDGCKSLRDRADSCAELKAIKKDAEQYAEIACREWTDVRSFGQVFAFKGIDVSVGVRGPVTIQTAVSVIPVDATSMQITKSVNSVTGDKKSSDTMGQKHRVDFGVYKFSGSINVQLAEKTGFTEEDAEKIKKALETLFENDCSSARPDGSMEIIRVYWWKHNCKSGQYSSAKVHRSVKISADGDGKHIEDYKIEYTPLDGLEAEVYDGLQ